MSTAVLERTWNSTREETVAIRDERARLEEAKARAFNGQISNNYARLLYGEPQATATPVMERAPVKESTPADRVASYTPVTAPASSRRLFDGVTYKDGVIYNATATVEAPVETPEVVEKTAPTVEETEDSLPTSKTMDTLRRKYNQHEQVSYGTVTELTSKAKLLLATIALVIVVAIAVICVNTSVLNSLNAQIGTLNAQSGELTSEYATLVQQIEDVTSMESVAEFAAQNGMTLS